MPRAALSDVLVEPELFVAEELKSLLRRQSVEHWTSSGTADREERGGVASSLVVGKPS